CTAKLVLAVCALGSRLSNDPRTLYQESQDLRSGGWKYFSQIRLVGMSFLKPSTIYDLQLHALGVAFLFPTQLSHVCWYIAALGIRIAQEVGAHRKRNLMTLPASQSRMEQETWKRAFWNITSTDLYMSIATGRPRSTREDDFDAELPPICDDEYWEIPSNPQLEFVQPTGKFSKMAYWHYFVNLLRIAGLAKDHLFSTRRAASWLSSSVDGNDKIVLELDSMLNSWMDALPDDLRWDPHRPNDTLFSQSVMLHTNYYWTQIQIHKSFIRPGPLSTGNFPSLAICTNAARSFVHILQVYHLRPNMPRLPHYIVCFLYSIVSYLT
ncbi:hypothetical protein BDP27DRAFT_1477043, partial [Rhodocollybia butyracea]